MPVPTWIAAESGFGIPTSWVMTSAISSRRASSSSATRRRSLPRSGAGCSDHAGNAAFAAATARSMSAGVAGRDGGEHLLGGRVDHLERLVPAGSTHAPSM